MRIAIFLTASIICSLILTLGVSDSFAARTSSSNSKLFYGEKKTPMYYNRANIILLRKSPPHRPHILSMPWREEPEQIEDPALVFDVEIRDGVTLYNQNGWFNLSSYSERTGVMMVFDEPSIQPITHSAQYAPTDILFIDEQGKISQIVPNILLSDLDKNIYPSTPILAFLFLKGGICAELSINAGDEVQYSLFKKPPTILNAPTQESNPDKKEIPRLQDIPDVQPQPDEPDQMR